MLMEAVDRVRRFYDMGGVTADLRGLASLTDMPEVLVKAALNKLISANVFPRDMHLGGFKYEPPDWEEQMELF